MITNNHHVPSSEKNLLALYLIIAQEWDYTLNKDLRLEQYTPKSSKMVWLKCKNCGERWKTTIDDCKKGYGCPFDSRRFSPGFVKYRSQKNPIGRFYGCADAVDQVGY